MEKKLNNFLFFIALFILYVAYSSIVVLVFNKLGININKLGIHSKNTFLILVDISLMIITYLIYRKDINRDFSKYFRHFGNYFAFGIEMWLIGIILMISSNLIIALFLPGAEAANETAVQAMLAKTPIYITFSACIFAPFMEEIIFRKALKKVFNIDVLYIIISGLLFGVVHNISVLGTINMIYIIPYGIFGSVFAYAYIKKNDIFVPIVMHMIHNTLLIIFSLYSLGVIFK